MKIDEIKTIVKMMAENDLTEFKIEAEEYNLCIKRGGDKTHVCTSAPTVSHAPAAPAAVSAAPAASSALDAAPAKVENTINSPIVGTFYAAPSPDAQPFVKVGDKVTVETVVCIVEAMKVMNEIKAEKDGVIGEILVQNATPVEYGQALFVIE
ncbi:MAG: acetyl-CoA carboxylase biotin carboxyl carrier protein [Victivallaceae bacterium]|nr:acetyl-CoA carboxylase biotin carboxyl carrier protein [Victivallaceae bacterium]